MITSERNEWIVSVTRTRLKFAFRNGSAATRRLAANHPRPSRPFTTTRLLSVFVVRLLDSIVSARFGWRTDESVRVRPSEGGDVQGCGDVSSTQCVSERLLLVAKFTTIEARTTTNVSKQKSSRVLEELRQPSRHEGAEGSWAQGRTSSCRPFDATKPHQRAAEASLEADDGLAPQAACRREPSRPQLQSRRPQSSLGGPPRAGRTSLSSLTSSQGRSSAGRCGRL